MSALPEPSPEAREHSRRLTHFIAEEIVRAGGWIDFARYMTLVLYAPGMGYYSAGAGKFGGGGDFVTAPELTPLFGRALARQAAQVLDAVGGDILELGAGTGRLAVDLLGELARLGNLPEHYLILDVSADLRARQRETFTREAPELLERVVWLDHLPERFVGLALGNEVLDALPVHLVHWREDGLYERGVAWEGEAFAWSDRRLETGPLHEAARSLEVPVPYLSEINLAMAGLIRSLSACLERGVVLFIDYGFPRAEYYHPQRDRGTLMCHYRHRTHDDPFFLPGLQDITAHVDFTAVAETGVDAGLGVLGYASQANFLIGAGITGFLQGQATTDPAYIRQVAALQKLMSPAEMGELFKAIALGKGEIGPLEGFSRGDRTHAL